MFRIALAVSLVLAGGGLCRADIASVRSALQSALAEQDETRVPKVDIVGSFGGDIKASTQEDIRSLLPLAHKCLQSRLQTVRGYGVLVFFLVTFRPDSSELLAPYIDSDLAPLLDDQDLAFKRGGIFVLGTSKPAPSAHALDLLSAHLADKNNTATEAGMIAATLLHERPSDAKSVRGVLDFVSRNPGLGLSTDTIRLLGLNRVSTEDAIKFIREGIGDKDEHVRKTSVEAAGRMPAAVRAKFSDDLLRVLADPDETAEIRALAEEAVH